MKKILQAYLKFHTQQKLRTMVNGTGKQDYYRLYKPVSDWLEMLPLDSTGLNM